MYLFIFMVCIYIYMLHYFLKLWLILCDTATEVAALIPGSVYFNTSFKGCHGKKTQDFAKAQYYYTVDKKVPHK